jgi:hypothetical protein
LDWVGYLDLDIWVIGYDLGSLTLNITFTYVATIYIQLFDIYLRDIATLR